MSVKICERGKPMVRPSDCLEKCTGKEKVVRVAKSS